MGDEGVGEPTAKVSQVSADGVGGTSSRTLKDLMGDGPGSRHGSKRGSVASSSMGLRSLRLSLVSENKDYAQLLGITLVSTADLPGKSLLEPLGYVSAGDEATAMVKMASRSSSGSNKYAAGTSNAGQFLEDGSVFSHIFEFDGSQGEANGGRRGSSGGRFSLSGMIGGSSIGRTKVKFWLKSDGFCETLPSLTPTQAALHAVVYLFDPADGNTLEALTQRMSEVKFMPADKRPQQYIVQWCRSDKEACESVSETVSSTKATFGIERVLKLQANNVKKPRQLEVTALYKELMGEMLQHQQRAQQGQTIADLQQSTAQSKGCCVVQ